MIVYLPVLTLEGIEGKLFRPMALTVVFALAASLFRRFAQGSAIHRRGVRSRPG